MRRLAALSMIALVSFASAPPAPAAPGAVVTTINLTFVPGDNETPLTLQVQRGSDLVFGNLDAVPFLIPHSVRSNGFKPGSTTARLFDSGILPAGQSGEVSGVPALAPGRYGFHCAQHELSMRGTLVVVA